MTATSDPPSSDVSDRKAAGTDPRSLSASVRRGALWVVASNLLLRLANISITAVVAHILSPHDFGIYAVALTAYAIVSSLGELGVSACLIRADLDIDRLAPTVASVSVVSSVILAGAMAAFATPIATALGSAAAAGPVRVMALAVVLLGVFAVPTSQMVRDFKQDKIFLANAIAFVPAAAQASDCVSAAGDTVCVHPAEPEYVECVSLNGSNVACVPDPCGTTDCF